MIFMDPYTKLLETAVDKLEQAVYLFDAEGKAIFLNKKARENMGLSEQLTYVGRHVSSMETLTHEESSILTCIATKQEVHNRLSNYQNASGKELYTYNTAYPFFSKGQLIAAVDFEEDVFLLEKRRQIIESLQEQARQAVVTQGIKKPRQYTLENLIGHSPVLLDLKKTIQKVAPQDSHILIVGDTGTGKEIVAQSIHALSRRKNHPLVVLNCAAVPETLVESILFGTVKGAYTGATNREGLFEAANGGTLFLDELNSMTLTMQAKLLRVLQEGVFRRVGENLERHVDIRVISTCNEDPFSLIQNKKLREDLFYRLATMVLKVPSLRERVEDLEELCFYHLQQVAPNYALSLTRIAPQALWLLQQYAWPGNVRELFHVLDYASNLAEGQELTADLLPSYIFPQSTFPGKQKTTVENKIVPNATSGTLAEQMACYEIQILEGTLRRNHGNITQSAKVLGLARQNLQYRLRKYQIQY